MISADARDDTIDALLPRGAQRRALADGSSVLWFTAATMDRALAARAIQCALLIVRARPDERCCVALSEGGSRNHWPIGPALNTALAMVQGSATGTVTIDAVTALFADRAFALRAAGESAFVVESSQLG